MLRTVAQHSDEYVALARRYIALEAAARTALAAYRAIGMGPAGWTATDRDAFAHLAHLLEPSVDESPDPPFAPAAAQRAA